ncbi:hypothetical protein ABIE26_002773 [Pedobacter africanus]|uniref:Uncharacterized protein n=1 Tax=Pedobacter africanus TaxID=151894 RepID=A0ACC6KWT5_9SPHI|nr:hypothetical protein [Pedobacter africanus]
MVKVVNPNLDDYSFKKDEYSKRLGRKFIKTRPLNADIPIFITSNQ